MSQNLYLTVVITTSPMIAYLLRTMPFSTTHDVKVASTEADARRIIAEYAAKAV